MPETSPQPSPSILVPSVLPAENSRRMSASFGDVSREFECLQNGAGVVDLSHRSKVELSGEDRASFLHNFCTNDIVNLPEAAGCEAFLTNHQGKILAWLQILNHEGKLFVHAEPGLSETIIRHLDRYLISERVEFADLTSSQALFLVVGPEALAKLPSVGSLGERQNVRVSLAGMPLVVERTNMFGRPCCFLFMNQEHAGAIWSLLRELGCTPVGQEAFEAFRISAGIPAYGREIDENSLPQEVDRTETAISFTKGCYIGQETVARIRAYGHVNRTVRKLRFTVGVTEPLVGAKIQHAGKEVGVITSGIASPPFPETMALANIRRGANAPGTEVEVCGATGKWVAQVLPARPGQTI